MNYFRTIIIVAAAYVLAHGLTAVLITPLQSRVLPEITTFASLLYLPHGVRVLAVWLAGPRAFVPLYIGGTLSEVLFTAHDPGHPGALVLAVSIGVGALCAVVAFEAMKYIGQDLYAGRHFRVHWTRLLLVGVIASLINSVGQSIVFSGQILTGHFSAVLTFYAVGDVIGLVITTLALMLVFRWFRLSGARNEAPDRRK
ncbi:MASE1 domain-containing protein [Salipiger mucosus]|uniref:Uncharacterized protein n=1 Tax=Salipiger mucosus DSM 16094 TaxID=1123237 RepID=S9R015_9RHOB|nr:MASE1 domain-containing protein [Salipiger mucosus]EPX86971.1 hypothetical protein Salmuc_02946 [Salipiger mucosus DSM 16094]